MRIEQELLNRPERQRDILGLYEEASEIIESLPETPRKKEFRDLLDNYFEKENQDGIKKVLLASKDVLKKIEAMNIKKFPGYEEETEDEAQIRRLIEELARNESNSIGKGTIAEVYINENFPEYCFKIVYNTDDYKLGNTIEEEFEWMENIFYLRVQKVRMPKPKFFVQNDKMHVLVMETINGATLEEVMSGEKKIPPNVNWNNFFNKVKDYTEELHNLGIYHRDMTGKNIMIDFETLEPVIIDFGRAKKITKEDDTSIAEENDDISEVIEKFNNFLEKIA